MHPKLTCHCVGACCVFLQTISNGHCSRRLFWENPIKPIICCLALQRTRRCCGSSHRNWWCFSQKRVSYTWQVHPPISCVSLLHVFTCSARRSPPSDDSAVDEVCCCGRGRTGGLRQRRLGCVSDGNRQQRPQPLGPDREVRALEKLRIWRLNLKVYASYQVLVYSCLFSSSTGEGSCVTHRATQSKPCEPKLRGWPGVGKSAKISSGLHRDQLLYSGLFQDITSLNCSNSRSQLIWLNSSYTNSSDSVGRFGWTEFLWPRRSAAIAPRLVLERLTETLVPETYGS